MTAAFVVISEAAESDIEGIARHISTDSVVSAEKFGLEFGDALNRIRAFPLSGHAVRGKQNLYLMRVSARFQRYLIVYRLQNQGVEVQRVFHSAMNLRTRLRDI